MMSCSVVVAAVTVVAVAVVVMSHGHEEPGPGVCLPNHSEFRDDVLSQREGHTWYAIDFDNNTMGSQTWLAPRNELYVYFPQYTKDYYWPTPYCNLQIRKRINLTHQMFPQCVPSTGRLVGDLWMFRNSQNNMLFYSNTKPSRIIMRIKLNHLHIPIVYKEWRDSFSDRGLLFFNPSCKNLSTPQNHRYRYRVTTLNDSF